MVDKTSDQIDFEFLKPIDFNFPSLTNLLGPLNDDCRGTETNYWTCAIIELWLTYIPVFNNLIEGYWNLIHLFLSYYDDIQHQKYQLFTLIVEKFTNVP